MRFALGLFLVFAGPLACRTSRSVVEVIDPKAPPVPPKLDYPHYDGSVLTSFKVTAISLPTPSLAYDALDLALKLADSGTISHQRKSYAIGEVIPIQAHENYEIIFNAVSHGKELYSSRFCSKKQSFRAEEGVNSFTVSLCEKP